MSEIKLTTEQVLSIAGRMSKCSERMNDITATTSSAIQLIENSTRNSSITNVSSKMKAVTKKMKSTTNELKANYTLLTYIVAFFKAVEKKIKDMLPDTKNLIPEWAKKTDPRGLNYYTAENGVSGHVCKTNDDGFLSCTYYTLRRLRERGLGYPFKVQGQGHGRQWFDNCSDSAKKYPGADCLTNLYNEYGKNGLPVKNIVISFGGGKYGHVVLIDAIYKDPKTGELMVEWSDMINYKSLGFKKLKDENASNPTVIRTLSDFKKCYSSSINGAVLIGE